MRLTRQQATRGTAAAAAVVVALALGACAGTPGSTAAGPQASVENSTPDGSGPSQPVADPTPESPATTPQPAPSSASSAAPKPSSPATTKPTVRPTPRPTSTPTPTPKPTSTPTPRPTSTPTPKPPTADPAMLRPDDDGPAVLALQKDLAAQGFWLGKPDGHYGGLTTQAVLALQKAAGLGRDGVAGPATQRALAAGARPRAHRGGSGIEIDLSRQILTVVRDGAVTLTLNTSTGSNQQYESQGQTHRAVTPPGSYTFFRSVNHEDVAPLGVLWRPRYFNGGIAVHGAASVPAFPASHGCARVSNAAMDMIWADGLMPMGSRVVVF